MIGKRLNVQPERLHKRRAKWAEFIERAKARSTKVHRKPVVFDWKCDGQKGAVEALTRSEARALIKQVLGVKSLKGVILVARAE